MRKADIENIVLWRTQGIGYAEIAKRLNISRDTVKSFCMRNKITVINQSDKCKFCGNPLVQKEKVKKKRFCSLSKRKRLKRKGFAVINADLTGGIKTLINSAEKLLTVLFVQGAESLLLLTVITIGNIAHINVI